MNIISYVMQSSLDGGLTDLLMWLGFCTAALLIVVGLVAFSVARRKKQKNDAPSA